MIELKFSQASARITFRMFHDIKSESVIEYTYNGLFIAKNQKGGKKRMAENELNKPDDDKTTPATETPTDEKPALDISIPGDNVVTYDFNTKNQGLQDKTPPGDNPPVEKPKEEKPPEAPKRRGKPPNPDKMDKPEPKPKAEKPIKEKSGGSAGGDKKSAGEEFKRQRFLVCEMPDSIIN